MSRFSNYTGNVAPTATKPGDIIEPTAGRLKIIDVAGVAHDLTPQITATAPLVLGTVNIAIPGTDIPTKYSAQRVLNNAGSPGAYLTVAIVGPNFVVTSYDVADGVQVLDVGTVQVTYWT